MPNKIAESVKYVIYKRSHIYENWLYMYVYMRKKYTFTHCIDFKRHSNLSYKTQHTVH